MKIILTAIIYCMLVGCTSDTITIVVPENPLKGLPDNGPIQLDNPAIGQRSYYVAFSASHTNDNNLYTYPGDTLTVGISGIESNQWVLKEFLTEGSVSKKNKSNSGPGSWKTYADSVFITYLKIDSDSIRLTRPASRTYYSFVFIGKKWAFQISPVSDSNPLNPQCSPAFYYGSSVWTEYSTNYSQFGKSFDHLNIYFDYRDMSTDGHGFMHAYGMKYGFVRISWISFWELDKASGWDLIVK
jgi:hypothetical protein